MKVSLEWLKEYVDLPADTALLAERLTMAGLEVESVERLGAKFDRFVTGRVAEVRKHPRADRLTLCDVDTGNERLRIVCGAPNVSAGQIVAVGLIGAVIPKNQHDPAGAPFVLSHVKLRGEDSFGMICSAYELGVGDDREGILILDPHARPGLPLADYFGITDTILEIGVTPNRPDALSHIGVAREIAALFGKKLRIPALPAPARGRGIEARIRVESPEECPRYSAIGVSRLTVAPSPAWMQKRLSAVGIRPVNNIVDVTNYVLMECGHPLHAFDYDRIAGHMIVVRRARPGEKLVTLDHKERALRPDTLLICDGERAVGIAGVMGGENTEIGGSTRSVLLEGAYFDARSIRRTSRHFSLSTEASQRFERGADPNITSWAVRRAAALIARVHADAGLPAPASPGKVIDRYPKRIRPRIVSLRHARVAELLGIEIDRKSVVSLLKGIEVTAASGGTAASKVLRFNVPTFRPDLEREVDLIEEAARLHGYDKIPLPDTAKVHLPDEGERPRAEERFRPWLIGRGFREIVANSMQDIETASIASSDVVRIANPISREMAALRTSLIPGALAIVRRNIFHGSANLRFFEFGNAYFLRNGANIEEERLLLLLTGEALPKGWGNADRPVDLFDLRGEIEALLGKISLDKRQFIPYPTSNALTEHGVVVEINGESCGFAGAVRSDLLARFEIDQPVAAAEIRLDALRASHAGRYSPLPRFPQVTRDLALVVAEEVQAGALEETIRATAGPLLREAVLFDVYRGGQVGPGKKSCAFALAFMSEERTLAQDEVDRVMEEVSRRCATAFGATLRK